MKFTSVIDTIKLTGAGHAGLRPHCSSARSLTLIHIDIFMYCYACLHPSPPHWHAVSSLKNLHCAYPHRDPLTPVSSQRNTLL